MFFFFLVVCDQRHEPDLNLARAKHLLFFAQYIKVTLSIPQNNVQKNSGKKKLLVWS